MGLLDRLFGKKAPPDEDDDDFESLEPTGHIPIDGPPEFIRAVDIQRAYWTHDPAEQSELEGRGLDRLGWRERLRLHHLTCLQRLDRSLDRAATTGRCQALADRLVASDSPYRPRPAAIWKGESAQRDAEAEPDITGELLNASLTHLGCLEIYRVDAAGDPTAIDFVGFDELAGAVFGPPRLLRAAKLFYEDGRSERGLVPLLYGSTWMIGTEFDRSGRMTRFVADLDAESAARLGASGIGVGHQDFFIRRPDGRRSLFGLGSVAEMTFPLDLNDPRFDEKARARGMDPEDIRRQVRG